MMMPAHWRLPVEVAVQERTNYLVPPIESGEKIPEISRYLPTNESSKLKL